MKTLFKLLGLCACLMWAQSAFAQVTVDTSGESDFAGNTIHTLNALTITSHSNQILLLLAGTANTTANGVIASVSGASCTWVNNGGPTTLNAMQFEAWTCKAPASGSQTVTVTSTGDVVGAMGVILYSLYNVDQATVANGYSTATSGNLVITTGSSNDMAVSAHFDTNSNRTVSGCTSSTDLSGFALIGYSSAHCNSTPTSTFTWSGFSGTSGAVGINVVVAGGGGGSGPPSGRSLSGVGR